MRQIHRFFFSGAIALFALLGMTVPAANAASVSIQGVYPSTSLNAGQTVSFYAVTNGFGEPTFSVSGVGSIDSHGYYTWTPTVSDAGGHTVMVAVHDLSGAMASSTVYLYVLPKAVLIQNLLPGAMAFTREPVTFRASAPGFTNPNFSVRDRYAGTTVSAANITATGGFSWTPAVNEQGLHTITVTATDLYGHAASAAQSLLVEPPSTQIIKLAPGTAVGVGSPVTFSASTTGLTNPTYAVSDSLGWFSTVGASSTDASGNFSWTPAKSDLGTHVLTLTASDANGSVATAKATITVSLAAPAESTVTPSAGTASGASGSESSGSLSTAPKQDGYAFTRYLRIGSQGTAVTELQRHLTLDGSYTGPVTGYFGPLTFAGVQRFQAAHGIEQVGVVGPQTRAALNAE